MKCLIWLRVSTVYQVLTSQKEECLKFAKSLNYRDEDITFLEGDGVSAIKAGDDYQDMMQDLYNHLDSDEINCVIAWEISRLARRESYFVNLKEYLIERKIQLRIITPSLYLLNEDGTVNNGLEITLGIIAIAAKQEMALKQARMARGKRLAIKQGKMWGGTFIPFGYLKGADGKLEVSTTERDIIYNLYKNFASGKWSVRGYVKYLNEIGFTIRERSVNYDLIIKLLKRKWYAYSENNRPTLIPKELYDKVQEIILGNTQVTATKEKTTHVSTKFLKCPKCGGNMIYSSGYYMCYNYKKAIRSCDCATSINAEIIDGVLQNVARERYAKNSHNDRREDIWNKINELKQKQNKIDIDIERLKEKKDRLTDLYIEGGVSKDKFKLKIEQIKKENADLELKDYHITMEIFRYNQALNVDNSKTFDILPLEDKRDIIALYCGKTKAEKINQWDFIISVGNGDGEYCRFIYRSLDYRKFKKDSKTQYLERLE